MFVPVTIGTPLLEGALGAAVGGPVEAHAQRRAASRFYVRALQVLSSGRSLFRDAIDVEVPLRPAEAPGGSERCLASMPSTPRSVPAHGRATSLLRGFS